MSALFVALGIMVLALLALLLWFVPHLLQQQATRVAGETTQLREMLVDLLNEQESVTIRQGQLNASLSNLQDQLSDIASAGNRALVVDQQASRVAENGIQQHDGQDSLNNGRKPHEDRLRIGNQRIDRVKELAAQHEEHDDADDNDLGKRLAEFDKP